MNDDEFITVATPLYLIESFEPCWKCSNEQRVIAFASRRLRADDFDDLNADDDSEPFLLSNITKLPREISEHVCSLFPQFQERYSKTTRSVYYANTCLQCRANFGDFYLFNEPGGAFFPDSEEQARRMTIRELPFTGTYQFDCSWGQGIGSFIFEYANYHNEP